MMAKSAECRHCHRARSPPGCTTTWPWPQSTPGSSPQGWAAGSASCRCGCFGRGSGSCWTVGLLLGVLREGWRSRPICGQVQRRWQYAPPTRPAACAVRSSSLTHAPARTAPSHTHHQPCLSIPCNCGARCAQQLAHLYSSARCSESYEILPLRMTSLQLIFVSSFLESRLNCVVGCRGWRMWRMQCEDAVPFALPGRHVPVLQL